MTSACGVIDHVYDCGSKQDLFDIANREDAIRALEEIKDSAERLLHALSGDTL
jgi:hypothetical protein